MTKGWKQESSRHALARKGIKTKILLKQKYYSKIKKGREPIRYRAKQPKGIGTTIYATIYLDPVLKKYKDLRKELIGHEVNEIKAWGKGSTKAHTFARRKEPKKTKSIGGVSGFWKEIRRREKK